MSTFIIYILVSCLLCLSFVKDKDKTHRTLKKAWKSFENIMPQFLSILFIIGIMLAVLDPQTIYMLLGKDSGLRGMTIAAVIGSITLIPGFVAFPLAAALLKAGAGYGQITMFITTLMMVGVVTLPVEIQFFGRATAIKRNLLALVFAVIISFVIGGIIS
ncbi:MAG: permease [Acholeplasmataceae bacterium]|nr:permease [Acholeplasmataceae bacterium]